MAAYIPIILLALLIVAPRKGGAAVSSGAKTLAVFVLEFGGIVMTLALAWNEILLSR